MKDNVLRLKDTKGMANLCVLMTSRCTLKCKHCATYTPYVKNKRDYDLDTLVRASERFINCINQKIGIVSIHGGEPFLNPQLVDYLSFLQKYEDQIGMIEIITNGSIIPSDELVKEMGKSLKVNVLIDNYGDRLSPHVAEIINLFESNNVAYRKRNYTPEDSWFDGWIDVTDFSEKGRNDEEIANLYKKCEFTNLYKDNYFLIDGVIHLCYVTHQLLDFICENRDESVAILSNEFSDEEINIKLHTLRDRRCLQACKNCNGYILESPRKTPAEQIEK